MPRPCFSFSSFRNWTWVLPNWLPLGVTWNVYLYLSEVIWSFTELVMIGMRLFSATGRIGSVRPEMPVPTAPATFWVLKTRSAVEEAFFGSLVVSTITSLIMAPPSALMPPALLMSSIARFAALRSC